MCNRFINAATADEIFAFAQALGLDLSAASAPGGEFFPDAEVPVLRPAGAGRLGYVPLLWGLPPPPGVRGPVANIRNLQSRWWREENREFLLDPRYRCLVPFTRFAEPARGSTWFAVTETPVAAFAGIWRPWHGVRRHRQADWELFAFLTTAANGLVRPVHPQAMPAILAKPEEMALWLQGGTESLRLQRPLPDTALEIVPAPPEPSSPQLSLF